MWQIITGGISAIVKEGLNYLAERQRAKTAVQTKIISGEIDYNVAAQQGMASSWKDEWLTVWTTGVVTALFFPQTQGYVARGFEILTNSVPDWFAYCFVGMYVAIYGLKGWKIFANK